MLDRVTSLLRSRWQASLVCSSLVHFALALIVAFELYLAISLNLTPHSTALTLEAPTLETHAISASVEIDPPKSELWMAVSAQDVGDLIASTDDPRWSESLLKATTEAAEQSASSDFISNQLRAAIAAAEQRSDEANLDRLEALSDQLTAVSSAESIDQMKSSLNGWLGSGERATEPAAEPVAGDFDFATAQLHDVQRDDSTGEVRYTAVLLDAAGRTIESPLTEAEGESIYRVMQLMKQNPLLERVYRTMVLGFMDNLLKQRTQ